MNSGFIYLINLLTIFVILTCYSCQKEKLEGEIVYDSELIANIYNKSLDTIEIANQSLTFETGIYRNLTPGGPLSGKDRRLTAPFWIVNIDSTLITNKIELVELYVIKQEQIWISQPEIEVESFVRNFRIYGISKGGPEWETGVSVNIILSIIDLTSNEKKYLIDRNQIIEKVE